MTKLAPADFIARIAPIAVQLRVEGSPIFPSLRIAQAAHETGWKIHSWNNLGGYKVGSGKLTPYWRGAIIHKGTWEVIDGERKDVTAAFRAYDSVEDFFRDQDLLFSNSRYARVRAAKTPEEQADMLQACGYATDPAYASKLVGIIKTYGLKRYDEEGDNKMQLSNYQWQRIETGIKSLIDRKIISDPAWLEKTQKRTLTRDELAWLTFELVANPR